MYAETKDIIYQSIDVVYPLMRDDIQKIVPYLPNVDKIETIKRERISDTRLEVVNHWYAKAEVPSIAKSFIKPELFQWKDFALWKDDEHCVEFRIESFVAKNLYTLQGVNYFIPVGDNKTELKITFNLDIYPERLPGVPSFLAKRAKGPIEDLVKRLLTPNLTSVVKGLNDYYAKEGGGKK